MWYLLPLPKKEVMFLVWSVCLFVCLFVCLSVCLSVCPITRKLVRILTKFFGGVGHGSRPKWYNFGGDPDHASDPGVQSPKSGSSGSAEVCTLWAYLVLRVSGTIASLIRCTDRKVTQMSAVQYWLRRYVTRRRAMRVVWNNSRVWPAQCRKSLINFWTASTIALTPT